MNVTELGQGGGLIGLPGDYTPPSRFVRATVLRHTVTHAEDAATRRAQAVAHILNNVDIPVGVAQSRTPDGKTRLRLHAVGRGQGPDQQPPDDRRLQ